LSELEERVDAFEKELAKIKDQVHKNSAEKLWWEKIANTFQGDPAHQKAMELGTEYRRTQSADESTSD
jgi:hypothetical protein